MDERGLGPYLAGLRRAHGWSVTDAALRIGVSKSHLSQLEGGKISLPNAGLRRQIANAYGVRHVALLVAAGELTPDEVAPTTVPTYPDDRLRLLAENWHLLSSERRDFIAWMVKNVRRDAGLDEEEEPVVAVTRVTG